MSRVYLLVEGQTEEAFVYELLQPHYSSLGLYVIPIIVSTSPGHKGGISSYSKVKPQIERLCRQHSSSHVSTLFDLYALPEDFPGKSDPAYPVRATGNQKADYLEKKLTEDIARDNFLPNLMVYEFEALLFSQAEKFSGWSDDEAVVRVLGAVARQYPSPEDINDGFHTAPSKRIKLVMPEYEKTVHGPLIADDIGLDVIRAKCPHFNAWLNRLESLIER